MKDENLEFFKSGKVGCVFARKLAYKPELIGWKRIFNPKGIQIPDGSFLVSYIFTDKTKSEVIKWAIDNGMYEEETCKGRGHVGLRYKNNGIVSYVQCFGKDSHVKTRQAPNAELIFCVKRSRRHYCRVLFKGILHMAHVSVEHLVANKNIARQKRLLYHFWKLSFKKTKKMIGHEPTNREVAKTTFIKDL